MRKLLIFLFFIVFSLGNSQIKDDTIILHNKDIITKIDTVFNTKIKPIPNIKYINKQDGSLLNGLYKIKIDANNYFITKYKNGIEDNAVLNVKKTFRNGELSQLDIKGYQIIGSKYISVPEYIDKSDVFLDGFIKEYSDDLIVDKIRIYQQIKKKAIYWKIYYPNKTIGKLRFNKTSLDIQ
jgi:hypothetical protein